MRNNVLRKEELALQIDCQTAIPSLASRIENGSVGANPGVVHEDINLSVGVERPLYNPFDLLFVRDVTLDEDRIAPITPDLIGGLVSDVLAPIDDDNFGALAREDFSHTLTDPPGRAGDDRNLVF
jgi:hypothetical protein